MLTAKSFKQGKFYFIVYIDKDGEITERFIRVVYRQEDRLAARCYLREEQRIFKYKSILSVRKVKFKKLK